MKALTICQPWATLIAIGVKTIETRSWSSSYRGPIAIHAAKRFSDDFRSLPVAYQIIKALRDHDRRPADCPTGAIIAVADLVGVEVISQDNYPGPPEREFGDFRAGRFAWTLRHIVELTVPLPCRGFHRLWNIPGEVADELRNRLEIDQRHP